MSCKSIIFLRGFVQGREKEYPNLTIAINLAEQLHYNQFRKTGEPYITHPAKATCNLIALGVYDDITLSGCMLHDVKEDCETDEYVLTSKYGLDEKVGKVVSLVSKKKGQDMSLYFKGIEQYPECILIKLADRCHNIRTMLKAFTKEKIEEYIDETITYVIPLCKYGKTFYPQYSNQFYNMRNTIEDVIISIQETRRLYEVTDTKEEIAQ